MACQISCLPHGRSTRWINQDWFLFLVVIWWCRREILPCWAKPLFRLHMQSPPWFPSRLGGLRSHLECSGCSCLFFLRLQCGALREASNIFRGENRTYRIEGATTHLPYCIIEISGRRASSRTALAVSCSSPSSKDNLLGSEYRNRHLRLLLLFLSQQHD